MVVCGRSVAEMPRPFSHRTPGVGVGSSKGCFQRFCTATTLPQSAEYLPITSLKLQQFCHQFDHLTAYSGLHGHINAQHPTRTGLPRELTADGRRGRPKPLAGLKPSKVFGTPLSLAYHGDISRKCVQPGREIWSVAVEDRMLIVE